MEGSPKVPRGHEFCWRLSYTFIPVALSQHSVLAEWAQRWHSVRQEGTAQVRGSWARCLGLCLWPVVGPGAVSDPVKFSLIGLQGSSLMNSVV